MKKHNKSIVNTKKAISFDVPTKDLGKTKGHLFMLVFLLELITIIVYSGTLKSDFVYYDDESYITTNEHVLHGLTLNDVKWAFSAVGYSDNWHPLTWISHMLDVQLFGLNPSGHHLTNLIFHILATLLLFGFLQYATGKGRLAAFIAGLFALHPMHVESVAWVAERKDVLSAVFGFATLWAYVYYVRKPDIKKYALVLVLFCLGLLSKPMLVTLPFVLLLLDFWPLERLTINMRTIGRLVIEKLPLFVLAAASSIITIIAQHSAIANIDRYGFSTRISNAIISYGVYVGQLFWPAKLSVIYPFTKPDSFKVIVCALLLIAISTAAIWLGRKKKYLITGWLWFLGTLVPVIGILQVGSQAHADRYTYIPYIGLFIMIAWGLNALAEKMISKNKVVLNTILSIIFLIMTIKTWEQIGYWKNGTTLFSHTNEVTQGSEIAYYILGNIMLESGRTDEAIANYQKALKINPNKRNALSNLAGAYYQKKQFSDAIPLIQRAIALEKAAGDEVQAKEDAGNLEMLLHEDSLYQK